MPVINDIDVQAPQDTTAAVRANPQLGQATFPVNGSWQRGCRLTAQTETLKQAGKRNDTRIARHASRSPFRDTLVSPVDVVTTLA
ncbi:MAG: hypothetical protein HOV92_06170 [Streptomyces sp.]|nr:hypothetical protein [Streptomyces sp.]